MGAKKELLRLSNKSVQVMKDDSPIHRNGKMLNNEPFILWCLNPTKELNEYWQIWMEQHPEQITEMERTKKIISSLRLNDDKMPEEEYRQLHSRILKDIRKRRK